MVTLMGGDNTMKRKKIDIGQGDMDIYVGKQLCLRISQVSDDEVINLFLYPEGKPSGKGDELPPCEYEILIRRKK